MIRPLLRTSACSLALFSAACSASGLDEAPGTSEDEIIICGPDLSPTPTPPDPCAYHLTRAADKTIEMNAGVTERKGEVPAPTQASCPSNVIDVKVPYNSSPDPDDCGPAGCYDTVEMVAGAGPFTGSKEAPDFSYLRFPKTQAACESFWLSVKLYRKYSRTNTFDFVKKRRFRGFWENGYCQVRNVCDVCETSCPTDYFPNDLYAPLPPAYGTDTYRIVTYAKANGSYIASRVIAEYEPKE